MATPLLLKLQRRDDLTAEEQAVVEGLQGGSRDYAAGETLVEEGDRPSYSSIMVSGWAGRAKIMADGRRTIAALHLPGDFIDLHSFLLKPMDHSVMAITDCRIAMVQHDKLKDATARHPHLARLFWLETLVDAAIHRAWIACLGRRSAPKRLAHLFCELQFRCRAVGLSEDLAMDFPFTRPVLADVLGISTVHVNRSLNELKRQHLIRLEHGRLHILNWDRLVEVAEFDPLYLNLNNEPR